MESRQLLDNPSIDTTAHRCLQVINVQDANRFVKKFTMFREQQDELQITHTYRELLIGAYLCEKGCNARYEWEIDKDKPDWCILTGESSPRGIVEVLNFHAPRSVDNDYEESWRKKGVKFDWPATHNNPLRLYERLHDKVTKYKALVNKHQLTYVIAVECDPRAGVQRYEVENCLGTEEGLFKQYLELSGVLLYGEGRGDLDSILPHYNFEMIANPQALRPQALTSA